MSRPIKVYDGDPIRFTGITDGFLSWNLSHDSLEAPIAGKEGASSNTGPLAPKYYYRERFRALDERERRLLHLRYFAGLSQPQIAKEVGISPIHVSRLTRRALVKLRRELGPAVPEALAS